MGENMARRRADDVLQSTQTVHFVLKNQAMEKAMEESPAVVLVPE